MNCPKCGTLNEDSAEVCKSCGQLIKRKKELAGFWRRYGAYALDILIIYIILIIMVLIVAFIAGFMGVVLAAGSGSGYNGAMGGLFTLGMCLVYIAMLFFVFLYYAWFESSKFQATPGKMAVGMQVVDLQGNRISFGKALVRNLSKILSGLILGLGFFAIGFTEKRQGLHDVIAGTTVVMKESKYL